jgi:hypothetical protein
MKINKGIFNDVIYKCEIFYYEIIYIMATQKWQNLIKFVDLKDTYSV